METEGKSPNRLWRESGTTLSFANWIQREKDKSNFLINNKFENFSNVEGISNYDTWLQDSISKAKIDLGIDAPKVNDKPDNTFIGLNKTFILISVLIIAGAIGYKIYKKNN
jgi:hypothetical protein